MTPRNHKPGTPYGLGRDAVSGCSRCTPTMAIRRCSSAGALPYDGGLRRRPAPGRRATPGSPMRASPPQSNWPSYASAHPGRHRRARGRVPRRRPGRGTPRRDPQGQRPGGHRTKGYGGRDRVGQPASRVHADADVVLGVAGTELVVTTGGTAGAQLETIGWLHTVLGEQGIDYWLFGGWAVDFHAGRVTRDHSDVDVAVWRSDLDLISGLLEAQGWARAPDPGEQGYTGYEREEVRVELAFLARDEAGTVYTPLPDGRGDWPAGSFGDAMAEMNVVHAPCRRPRVADRGQVRRTSRPRRERERPGRRRPADRPAPKPVGEGNAGWSQQRGGAGRADGPPRSRQSHARRSRVAASPEGRRVRR